MAHKKAGGSAKNLRDSNAQYLGLKLGDGQKAKEGQIIVRQRGTKILPGANIGIGKDHTLFALTDGIVKFVSVRKTNFTGKTFRRRKLEIVAS